MALRLPEPMLTRAGRRPPPQVTAEARAWWLEHLGAAEARELARSMAAQVARQR